MLIFVEAGVTILVCPGFQLISGILTVMNSKHDVNISKESSYSNKCSKIDIIYTLAKSNVFLPRKSNYRMVPKLHSYSAFLSPSLDA